ncbi:MAG: hypothetical protein F6K31_23450 [Symploca sp. SIO2G7]|nr:hypothetical protein [Symploca sp. SIO2G7]
MPKPTPHTYSSVFPSLTKEYLQSGERVYYGLEIDTEFWQPPSDINHPVTQQDVPLTVQMRDIKKEKGLIFAHPAIKAFARHELMKTGFAPVDYLKMQGHEAHIYRADKPVDYPFFQFDIYCYFAPAEICRIVTGEYQKDIRNFILSTNPKQGQIVMERRLRTVTAITGSKQEPWIEPNWVLTIDGYNFRVAVSIIDCCAVHGIVGYAEFCKNSGVELQYKDTFTKEEKSDMLRMYIERPEDFDNYALGDLYNHRALIGNLEKFKTIYSALELDGYYKEPKLTMGSTDAQLFTSILLKFLKMSPNQEKQLKEICRYGTADFFKDNYGSTTGVYLAKVDGGRCRNNRPVTTNTTRLIADADISGCYGNGLKNQIYPVGRPIIVDYPIKSDWNSYLTLRDFWKKYKKELVPGLWFARVSTKPGYELKYPQDYLTSWHPPKDPKKIPTDTSMQSVEFFTIDNVGLSKIFSREVHLATITHDFINWLEKVASPRQRKELLDNLVVNSAVFYPAKERCKDEKQFFDRIKNFKGGNYCEAIIKRGASKVIKIHKECHSWLGINMGDLIVDQLLEERAKYSKTNPDEKPFNTLYKLIINTLYGDMVSPFFAIGNTVVGSNITARARAMAWYMEKSLNGFQTITDGCAFEINRVIYPKKEQRLTSETLFESYLKEYDSAYQIKPLGTEQKIDHHIKQNKNTETGEVKNQVELVVDGERYSYKYSLDWLAEKITEHLKQQFPGVDVISQFKFEIKDIYTSASFHGTANYKFWIGEQAQKGKMRSYRKDGYDSFKCTPDELVEIDDNYSPSEECLIGLRDNPYALERSRPYLYNKILKPGEYKKNYHTSWQYSDVLPGYTVYSGRLLRECSLTQFTFQTKKQFDSWEREQKRLRDKHGQSYEAWFLNDDGQLDFQTMIVELDKLIRTGTMRFSSSREAAKQRHLARELSDHPEFETLNRVKTQLDIRYGRERSN